MFCHIKTVPFTFTDLLSMRVFHLEKTITEPEKLYFFQQGLFICIIKHNLHNFAPLILDTANRNGPLIQPWGTPCKNLWMQQQDILIFFYLIQRQVQLYYSKYECWIWFMDFTVKRPKHSCSMTTFRSMTLYFRHILFYLSPVCVWDSLNETCQGE